MSSIMIGRWMSCLDNNMSHSEDTFKITAIAMFI